MDAPDDTPLTPGPKKMKVELGDEGDPILQRLFISLLGKRERAMRSSLDESKTEKLAEPAPTP